MNNISLSDLNNFIKVFIKDDHLDVVVFAAPQLSLNEMRTLELLDGNKIHQKFHCLYVPSAVKVLCGKWNIKKNRKSWWDNFKGVCFYNMHARDWRGEWLKKINEQFCKNN